MRPHHKIWQTIHSRHGRHGSLGSASPHALSCSFGSVAAIHTFDMTLRSTCSRCKWTVQDSHGSLKFIEVHWSALKLIVVHLRSLMFIEVLWSSLNFIDVHCADAHSAWLCRRWPQRAVQRDLIGLTCCNLESGRLFGPRSKDGRHPGLIGLAHGEGPGGPGMGLGVAWHSIAQRLSIVRFRQDRNSAPDSKRQSFKDSDGQRWTAMRDCDGYTLDGTVESDARSITIGRWNVLARHHIFFSWVDQKPVQVLSGTDEIACTVQTATCHQSSSGCWCLQVPLGRWLPSRDVGEPGLPRSPVAPVAMLFHDRSMTSEYYLSTWTTPIAMMDEWKPVIYSM